MLSAENAVRQQSYVHSDGWGVGYYAHERAELQKEPLPAHDSSAFENISKTIRSRTFIVHIRQRTAGKISLKNTHPFQLGNWLLAQNGGIGADRHEWIQKKIGQGQVKGRTSGEHLLFWLYHRAGKYQGVRQVQAVKDALIELLRDAANITSANFILTTNDRLYAFRYAPPKKMGRTLFYLERMKNKTAASEKTGLNLDLDYPPPSTGMNVFLAASEKITSDEDWHTVENGEMLAIDQDLNLQKINVF